MVAVRWAGAISLALGPIHPPWGCQVPNGVYRKGDSRELLWIGVREPYRNEALGKSFPKKWSHFLTRNLTVFCEGEMPRG